MSAMTREWGVEGYRYEFVENWPQVEIQGVAADVAGDSDGRIYTVVRDPKPDGSVRTQRRGRIASFLIS